MARIVILDDQPDICEIISQSLIRKGHDVRVANVGDEAIDFGHLFKPDVLITDWRLESDYDGFEVSEAIRHVNQDLKTIMITGYAIDEIEHRIRKAGFVRVISKPFRPADILGAVEDSLQDDLPVLPR